MSLRRRLARHIHKQDIQEICLTLQNQKNGREELFALLFDEDKRTADNAAWTLTHLPKEYRTWLASKQNALIDEIMKTTSTTKRRLILTLLERQPFAKEDLRTEFLDFCLLRIASPIQPVGIRALCVKLAYKQCHFYPELLEELKHTLDMLEQEGETPAIKNVKKNILKQI